MNNLNNLTFKQAKSLNRKHFKDLANDVAPATDYINLRDLVSEHLKTDDDLPVKYKILFHLRNPHGLVNRLPRLADVTETRGGKTYTALLHMSNTRHRNRNTKKLEKWHYTSKSPTKIDLRICLESLQLDVKMYEKFKANKEEWFDKAIQNKETA